MGRFGGLRILGARFGDHPEIIPGGLSILGAQSRSGSGDFLKSLLRFIQIAELIKLLAFLEQRLVLAGGPGGLFLQFGDGLLDLLLFGFLQKWTVFDGIQADDGLAIVSRRGQIVAGFHRRQDLVALGGGLSGLIQKRCQPLGKLGGQSRMILILRLKKAGFGILVHPAIQLLGGNVDFPLGLELLRILLGSRLSQRMARHKNSTAQNNHQGQKYRRNPPWRKYGPSHHVPP